MKRIGLISDTHGFLDDKVARYFKSCDEIWHAGDFGTRALVDELQNMKPLRGVYGNIDGQDIRSMYPEVLRFSCEEIPVLMIHIGGYPNRYSAIAKKEISLDPPKLFISGHSHIVKIMYDEKFRLLHMNPGAAGKQGWQKVRTLIRFTIDGKDMKDCEVVEL